jgi:hypothetical protein
MKLRKRQAHGIVVIQHLMHELSVAFHKKKLNIEQARCILGISRRCGGGTRMLRMLILGHRHGHRHRHSNLCLILHSRIGTGMGGEIEIGIGIGIGIRATKKGQTNGIQDSASQIVHCVNKTSTCLACEAEN